MGEKEIDNLIKIWEEFVDNQKTNEDSFILNPDKQAVKRLAKGMLFNEKKHGLKYCPCRMTTGNREEDLKLICPCNFKIQNAWKEKGECWCSLFVKAKW